MSLSGSDRPVFPYRPANDGSLPWFDLKKHPDKSAEALSQTRSEFDPHGGRAGFDLLVEIILHLNTIPGLMSTHCESAFRATTNPFTNERCELSVTDLIVILLSNGMVTAMSEDCAANLANNLIATIRGGNEDGADFNAIVQVAVIQMLIDHKIGYGVRILIEGFGKDRASSVQSWTTAMRGMHLALNPRGE